MRADRLLSLLLLLQTRERTPARELAAHLEVSERTIYRDLDALSAAGIPVYAERGPGGGCALAEGYRTTLNGLTEREVRALFLSGFPGAVADGALDRALGEVLRKFLTALPASQRDSADRARQRVHLDTAPWFQPAGATPHLATLQDALWHDRFVAFTYRRRDGVASARIVAPYGLVAKVGVWYLVAGVAGEIRTFRVSRIQDATLTDERFDRPADFDLASYWATWCAAFTGGFSHYDVTVRIAPEGVPLLADLLGESVHALIAERGVPDGDGRLRLPLTFETLAQARTSLLALGTLVEALEPEELRASLAETAVGIAALYGKTHPPAPLPTREGEPV
ncbi:MAG: helix-turn-helix transcriptional regulator [Thermomicrobiales bacterium]